jgi:hypothetical protein
VISYRNYADVATLEARVRDLVVARKMDREIARALNADGLLSAHGRPFSGGEVHLLRKRSNIPTVKINRTEHNPRQWPDGTYSVQGAAEALSVSAVAPLALRARKPARTMSGGSSAVDLALLPRSSPRPRVGFLCARLALIFSPFRGCRRFCFNPKNSDPDRAVPVTRRAMAEAPVNSQAMSSLGLHETLRWRERDPNRRSLSRRRH